MLCQAKSGMGKTAVFVISIINTLEPKVPEKDNTDEKLSYTPHSCIVVCHTRELAHQVQKDFRRLSKTKLIKAVIFDNLNSILDATLEEFLTNKTLLSSRTLRKALTLL